MKKHIFKYIIALNFVILAMPFFQTCSDSQIIIQISQENLAKNNREEISPEKREEMIVAAQEEYTANGYQLLYGIIQKIPAGSLDIIDIIILLIPMINIIHFVVSIKKHFLTDLILGFSTFALSVTELALILINCDNVSQIKYGLYALVINSLLICLSSIKTSSAHLLQKSTQVY